MPCGHTQTLLCSTHLAPQDPPLSYFVLLAPEFETTSCFVYPRIFVSFWPLPGGSTLDLSAYPPSFTSPWKPGSLPWP